MPRKSRPWPVREMTEWYSSGMTMGEIAVRLSSPEWQRYWTVQSGSEFRPHKVSVRTVLLRSGCSIRNASERMAGRHPAKKPWPLSEMSEWYRSGMSLQEIADRLCSLDWQPYWVGKIGTEYHPGQKIVNKVMKKHIQIRKTGAPGSRNGSWKGGRHIDKGGYILVHQPDHPMATAKGCVREHRLIVEATIGRFLTDSEVVHHIDDDPGNNTPSNLMVYETNAKHIRETKKGVLCHGRIEHSKRLRAVRSSGKRLWPDQLLQKWHVVDHLSLAQIAQLLGCLSTTVSTQLSRLGLHDRQVKAGNVTDAHREECLQFRATHWESEADAQE